MGCSTKTSLPSSTRIHHASPNGTILPIARTTDPETSHQAAASVTHVSRLQAHLLALYQMRGPLTDTELIDLHAQMVAAGHFPPATDSGIRTRRSELGTSGKLWDVGRSTTPSGRACTVWDVVRG